jgi:ATP-dependent DNA helicase RecG
MGFVERLGYGLNRVMNVMRQHNLRTPRFEEVGNSFRVTLFGELPEEAGSAARPNLQAYLEMGLNQRQQEAITFLLRHRRITNRDFQDVCPDVSAETLRRDLSDLVSRGLLVKVGDKRATYYVLKK